MSTSTPILYSFRRCPFAIRARIAIYFSKIRVELREVSLRNKPKQMIKISKKSTVPVLKTNNFILDESLEIIIWALNINDEKGLLVPYKENKDFVLKVINRFDNKFKYHLDRYKYSSRFLIDKSFKGKNAHRELACNYIRELNNVLLKKKSLYIYKNKLSIVDLCIFPLIRQFKIADADWFEKRFKNSYILSWFNNIVTKDYFLKIMYKYKEWSDSDRIYYFSYEDVNNNSIKMV